MGSSDEKASEAPGSGERTLADGEYDEFRALNRGESVDRYVVLDRLGAGGMGIVYTAYDPELDRRVAIKQLRAETGDDLTHGHGRLAREARAMAQLTHPNVITVHDVGESHGGVFIAMEYVDGQTLSKWGRKQHPWPEVLRVYLDAARGLAAAHAAGLTHRDFKPENVMLGTDGRVRVMDFGLARGGDAGDEAADELDPQAEIITSELLATPLTQVGAILGSPAYMSPEQHLGVHADTRSDQFSFCVALHEALYGRRPFRAASMMELAAKVTAGERTPPPKDRDVPPWIYAILERGLAAHPDDRWPSMDALIGELDRQPKKRSWALVVGAGAVGTMIAIAVGMNRSDPAPPPDPCAAGDERVAEVWNPKRRSGVETALLGTGAVYAEQTWKVVAADLDEYTTQWKASWRDACEDTHVRHEQSGDRLDQRMDCLERRRNQMGGLIEGLSHADSETLQAAAAATAALPPVEHCSDPGYLDNVGRTPADPETATQVDALLAEIDEAFGLRTAREREGLLSKADTFVERARNLRDPMVVIEALRLRGNLAADAGDLEGGVGHLEEAYFLARSEGYLQLAAHIGIRLTQMGRTMKDPVQSTRRWGAHAQADITRAGADPVLQATLWNALANAADINGEYAEAEKQVRRSLALVEDTQGTNHNARIETLMRLAAVLESRAKYDESAKTYEEALVLISDRLGDQHPVVASTLNNYGNVLVHDAQFELALEHMEAAHEVFIAVYGENHPNISANLSARAGALEGMGRYEEALALLERSLKLRLDAHGPDHVRVAWAEEQIAAVLNRLGRHEEAFERATHATTLLEKQFGADSHLVAYGLVRQGVAEHGLGKNRTALATLERALALRSGSEADPSTIASVEWALARTTWDLGQTDRGLELAKSARDTYAGDAPLWRPTVEEIDAWLDQREPPEPG